MAQIIGYLAPEEVEAFQRYAGELNVDATALANLLILRELHFRRVVELSSKFDRGLVGRETAKIIAHQKNGSTKALLQTYAESLGMKPSRIAAIIFRAEITEQWLAKAVESELDSA